MKKLLYLLALVFALAGCQKDEPKPETKKFSINQNAKVRIEGTQSVLKSSAQKVSSQYLSDLEIVKQADRMYGYNEAAAGTSVISLGWHGKDTISDNPAFLRQASDIIADQTGYGDYGIVYDYIDAYDLTISRFIDESKHTLDTLAYIPNENIRTAKVLILEAWEAKDTTALYDIFNNAFKFKPITGVEWRALKKQNLQ